MTEYWGGLDPVPTMDDEQFAQWCELLRVRTGMRMPMERKSFLVTSLSLRMREVGYQDFQSYYEYLTSGKAGKLEWAALVDKLTVHETRFFRDSKALQYLDHEFLPEFLEKNQNQQHINMWSVGCSTGEEPYSLAVVMEEYIRHHKPDIRYGITATDISLLSLATGKRGLYGSRAFIDMPQQLLGRYFEPAAEGKYQAAEQIKQRICFAQLNILDAPKAPVGEMDIIYCQNVLIYFDWEKRPDILNGLIKHLRPGGVLVLGAGEMIGWQNPLLERVQTPLALVYRRVASD